MKYNIAQHSKHANTIRNEKLTPAERSSIASVAAKARWAKYKLKKSHTCVNLCRCANCGRFKYKHITKDMCERFSCDT